MKVVLLGPQACGKGTQAFRMTREYKIPSISTGDLFRREIEKKSELGLKAEKFISKGELVPDDVTFKMLGERLKQEDCKKGFILDGFPRTLKQAKFLDTLQKIDAVIYLNVDDAVIAKRLSTRRICSKCKKIYNTTTYSNSACEDCGGKLVVRDDDKPEAIKTRLEIYKTETVPLIDFYNQKGLLREVDGDGPADFVFQLIKTAVYRSGANKK